ncbi:MAG: ferredoxin [Thermodesulfobacteriota bacterium]
MKRPSVDLADCVDCEGCTALCPEVFFKNDQGKIQVKDLARYPEACVEECIKNCPGDCIQWEEE